VGTVTDLVAEGYGPPESYSVRQVPIPTAGPGQLQVRIRAAAVNPLDMHLFGGDQRDAIPMAFRRRTLRLAPGGVAWVRSPSTCDCNAPMPTPNT